jgi:hypothetical protein
MSTSTSWASFKQRASYLAKLVSQRGRYGLASLPRSGYCKHLCGSDRPVQMINQETTEGTNKFYSPYGLACPHFPAQVIASTLCGSDRPVRMINRETTEGTNKFYSRCFSAYLLDVHHFIFRRLDPWRHLSAADASAYLLDARHFIFRRLDKLYPRRHFQRLMPAPLSTGQAPTSLLRSL